MLRSPGYVLRVAIEDFDLILFDLGGVLVRLGGIAAMRQLAGIESDDELWARWLACRWVREFERGQCSSDDFAAGLVSDWGLEVSPSEFLERFASWPEALHDGATDLVGAVRIRLPVGCLSNTNSVHWEVQGTRWGLEAIFDLRFLSYELGLIKPDREIFDHVIAVTGHRPERIVFLDDNALNVEAAKAAGLTALQAAGVDEARAALNDLDVLAPRP